MTFSLANNRNSARSENSTDWKTAFTQSIIRVSRAIQSAIFHVNQRFLAQSEEWTESKCALSGESEIYFLDAPGTVFFLLN